MPKLTHATTGVTVEVSEATAKHLGAEWGSGAASGPRSESPDSSWKVADLKAYAEENDIDLGGATKKDDIVAAIAATSESETESQGETDSESDE